MKKILLLVAVWVGVATGGHAQRILSEGSVVYQLTSTAAQSQSGAADVFNGAKQTIWFKGDMVRTDFVSVLLSQSTIFNNIKTTGVILKEAGNEKYMLMLDSAKWRHYNRKFVGISYKYTGETQKIAGFDAKQAIGTLRDGSTITAFYATELRPYTSNYDMAFVQLPGLVLMYEVETAGVLVRYTATAVNFSSVSLSRYDLPKSGFKLLTYKQ